MPSPLPLHSDRQPFTHSSHDSTGVLQVRSQINPEAYAAGKAREGARKSAQLGRNTAEQAVRALLATPLMEVNVEEAKTVIEEAEEANVLPTLIDKAVEHVQDAAEAQMQASPDLL